MIVAHLFHLYEILWPKAKNIKYHLKHLSAHAKLNERVQRKSRVPHYEICKCRLTAEFLHIIAVDINNAVDTRHQITTKTTTIIIISTTKS